MEAADCRLDAPPGTWSCDQLEAGGDHRRGIGHPGPGLDADETAYAAIFRPSDLSAAKIGVVRSEPTDP